MNILNSNNDIYTLDLTADELQCIRICAMHIPYDTALRPGYDIFQKTGWSLEEANNFLDDLRNRATREGKDKYKIVFVRHEIIYLRDVIRDCLIDMEREFHTLVGVWPEQATLLRAELMVAL
ncbi:MAG: hypothetical protein P8P30_04255 [Rickettsiales bacterium]|nr:hypothetical protein [Rickettsiales bacterium]